jgi:hypothetical protein
MTDTRDDRVDQLRRQLQALGYLDAGVDRFVLHSATGTRRPAAIAALASVRVGLLAAVLLGPAAAVGIIGRLPGLVTGPRDAVVIAIYLAAIFGLSVAAFTVVLSLIWSRVAAGSSVKHARWSSRAAGALVTTACLLYLTLWWRTATAGFVWASPVWTLSALAVAATISLLLGHAVAITTFAVMVARERTGGELSPQLSHSTWRIVLAAGVVAFAGAAALLFASAPASLIHDARPPLTVVSPGFRLTVIAIDGFDLKVFDAMRASGELPALAQVVSSAHARFAIEDGRDPAREWTTTATGQPPEVHGVRALETRRVAGVKGAVASDSERGLGRTIRDTTDLLRLTHPSIVSGTELRAKPFWEVAADAGLRAAVVNWWATWPARDGGPFPSIVVSDRAALRLERGGDLDAEIAPKELYDRLRVEWPSITQQAARAAASPLLTSEDPQAVAVMKRSAELDALQLALAMRLPGEKPDLLAVYFPGLDVAQHTLLDPGAVSGAALMSARVAAVHRYYTWLDSLLSDVLRGSSDEMVVVVTHPGRRSSSAEGLLAIAGSAAAPGAHPSARSVDIAPTILYALGVPVSRALAGRPLLQVFSSKFTAAFPVREVPTYGARDTVVSIGRGQPLDAEALERLRSLGYVR